MVVVIEFKDDKIESEHIYWDQASVLVQVRLLDGGKLPVAGVQTAHKMRDPSQPSNTLMGRTTAGDQA